MLLPLPKLNDAIIVSEPSPDHGSQELGCGLSHTLYAVPLPTTFTVATHTVSCVVWG